MTRDRNLVQGTVVHLVEHMARIKSGATLFYESTTVRKRGFFGPGEDEQVVQLWVSYHMARNALLEVISDYRLLAAADDEGDSREALADFAVAYAAAVVLVDAARFLRELFADEPVIRRKLNESFALYGIEAESFDAIQMSLSDPMNVWQLYQANQFYDEQAATLRELAASSESLAGVVGIIERLGDRLRVSAKDYAKTRATERARDAYDTVMRSGVARAIYSIQSWVSRWVGQLSTKPEHRPALPEAIKGQLLERLRPGDVLVTRKEHSLTNYFLPGYWPHAALYIGEGQVVEALADGVRVRSIESPFGADALASIRPQLGDSDIERAIERAHTHVGKPYDFDFDFTRADRMVCTEVVYRSYEGLGEMKFDLTWRAARQNLSAEDLLNLSRQQRFFRHVAVYCPLHSRELLCDDQIEAVLRATMDG